MGQRPTSVKESGYVIFKKEYDHFEREYLFRRRRAVDVLKSLLKEKDTDNWQVLYSYLCEYIAVLYRFEEMLDDIPLSSRWNSEQECWEMHEQIAVNLMHLVSAESSCRHILNNHSLSFLSH